MYQKAINICLIHERTHLAFEHSPDLRTHWLTLAEHYLSYLSKDEVSERWLPDRVTRTDILYICQLFRENSSLLEEIACDIYSLENAIYQELERQPEAAGLFPDGYIVAARLMVLTLYVGRTIAKAAVFAVQGLQGEFSVEEGEAAAGNQLFLSQMRLRIMLMLMHAQLIRDDLGLPPLSASTAGGFSPIDANGLPFDQLMASLQTELQACRQGDTLKRAMAVGRFVRKLDFNAKSIDNRSLLELYLFEHWS